MQREEEASAAMDQTEYNDDGYGEEDDEEYDDEEDEQPRPKGVARLGVEYHYPFLFYLN